MWLKNIFEDFSTALDETDARTFRGSLEYADAVSSSRRGRDRSEHERSE